MILKKEDSNVKGILRMDKKTKNIFSRIKPGEIAIINHPDLDEVAAEGLLRCRIKAVINASSFMTGHYPNKGPELLINNKIQLVELPDDKIFSLVKEGEILEIKSGNLWHKNRKILSGCVLTKEDILRKKQKANNNMSKLLDDFVQNTLDYALKEKDLILGGLKLPKLSTIIKGKHVLVVVRGQNYRQDLKIVLNYIEEEGPVLIGVDGGSDALLEFGFTPDIIIGDMDSVSDKALRKGKEILVHAYADGRSPGEEKLKELGLNYKVFPSPGTSEDIALLLAYEKGAELIVALGTHSNMIDFLEKGRPGMASTFLVRLKVGSRLIDAKGVSQLYSGKYKSNSVFLLIAAAIIPMALIISFSPLVQHFFRLIFLRMQFNF